MSSSFLYVFYYVTCVTVPFNLNAHIYFLLFETIKREIIFLGNVALINLGLSEEEYTYVCTDVDFIIHAAATVNLIYPYTVGFSFLFFFDGVHKCFPHVTALKIFKIESPRGKTNNVVSDQV